MKIRSLLTGATAALLAAAANAAVPAISCEQLAEIAYVTERLRDNGTSLPEVMSEADRLEATKRYSAVEITSIRDTIENAFKRIRTSNETLVECRAKLKR
jgi:hypothetical protein